MIITAFELRGSETELCSSLSNYVKMELNKILHSYKIVRICKVQLKDAKAVMSKSNRKALGLTVISFLKVNRCLKRSKVSMTYFGHIYINKFSLCT